MTTVTRSRSFAATLLALACAASGSYAAEPRLYPIGLGWAKTKVNCVIFRHNAVCSWNDWQFAAYYDPDRNLVLAKRRLDSSTWETRVTTYRGHVQDAHNSISIALDGDGFLHLSWDHHGNKLNYCRSRAPGSLDLTEPLPMVGTRESRVTYPEFYLLPDGDLLLFYRHGASGSGDLVLNRYRTDQRRWERVHDNLVSGEGARNAYWQVAIDTQATIHLSWVWRETPDVETNHDLAYARSADGGKTWTRTDGSLCPPPITAATAEYAARIPQRSELANQTSMDTDDQGRPYIANFWREAQDAAPQYRIVFHRGEGWRTVQVGRREVDFRREGGGTKRSPVSRPRLLIDGRGPSTRAYLLFRDIERERRMSVASCENLPDGQWTIRDLTASSVGQADPLHDPIVWQQRREIHLFTQFVGQGDGETMEDLPPQMVSVVAWSPHP